MGSRAIFSQALSVSFSPGTGAEYFATFDHDFADIEGLTVVPEP